MKQLKIEELNLADPVRAANSLLEDEGVTTIGARVSLIDDQGTYPAGTSGVVKGVSAKGAGYVDVELENGSVIPVMSSLLLVSK
jgi:hypothetical protein